MIKNNDQHKAPIAVSLNKADEQWLKKATVLTGLNREELIRRACRFALPGLFRVRKAMA
ncbi:MAG: hypothetical protein LBH01_03340 [Verrucomicrobiales bacterium]|jgi:hypothetical protein|nr:hypothetical protein [Verrucomicrobiales bacterium]